MAGLGLTGPAACRGGGFLHQAGRASGRALGDAAHGAPEGWGTRSLAARPAPWRASELQVPSEHVATSFLAPSTAGERLLLAPFPQNYRLKGPAGKANPS